MSRSFSRASGRSLGATVSEMLLAGNEEDMDDEVAFKSRVLQCLQRLGGRDTQRIAAVELLSVAQLPATAELPHLFAILMSCVLETNESQGSGYKKEVLSLLGSIAALHMGKLEPYLPRIVSTLCSFMRDKEQQVREHVSDCLAHICSAVPPPSKQDALSVYFKPLCKLLQEHNKNLQCAAASSIVSVVRCSPPECVVEYVDRLVPLFSRLLNQGCLCTQYLLVALAALMEATRGAQQLPTVVQLLLAHTVAEDWSARKGAVDSLLSMGRKMKMEMTNFKPEVRSTLEELKHDKMRPVRDAVSEALLVYEALPGSPPAASPTSSPIRPSSVSPAPMAARKAALQRSTSSLSHRGEATPDKRPVLQKRGTVTSIVRTRERSATLATPELIRSASSIGIRPNSRAGKVSGSKVEGMWSESGQKITPRKLNMEPFKDSGSGAPKAELLIDAKSKSNEQSSGDIAEQLQNLASTLEKFMTETRQSLASLENRLLKVETMSSKIVQNK